jgi:hypothetical protein
MASLRTEQRELLDMMFGAAYHRLLHGHRPLNDKFVHEVVDLIMAAVSGGKA